MPFKWVLGNAFGRVGVSGFASVGGVEADAGDSRGFLD
jgi:hypothetical protein